MKKKILSATLVLLTAGTALPFGRIAPASAQGIFGIRRVINGVRRSQRRHHRQQANNNNNVNGNTNNNNNGLNNGAPGSAPNGLYNGGSFGPSDQR